MAVAATTAAAADAQCVGQTGERMGVPSKFRAYNCEDYFASDLAARGWWSAEAQYWYIEPAERIREEPDLEFLVIGGPGVDGLMWGYRKGLDGLWLYYPIDDAFVEVAESALDLQQGYESGRISV